MGEGPVPVGGSGKERPPPGGPREAEPSISPRENRPYLRPLRSKPWFAITWVAALVAAAVGALIAYYLWATGQFEFLNFSPRRAEPAPPVASAPEPARPDEPAIRHPLAVPLAGESLPALGESDRAFGEALGRLIGYRGLIALLQPDRLIVRIVATVDNLPRAAAPARLLPLKPAPGVFEATGGKTIGARNAARYETYMALARDVDAKASVDLYVRFYPLFQQAYAELGYPKGYFNDRLIQAIDNLLATPEAKEPIELVRPKVLYEYADPALESLSAGQKILLRMGSANTAKVKAKLREIRAEIEKRSTR